MSPDLADPAAPRARPAADPPGADPGGSAATALLGYGLAQVAFFVLLRAVDPRFFWLDDQQAQYLPAFHWLGKTAVGGRPALFDPDAGGGGNLLADPQYGVLDPVHWLIDWVVSRLDSVQDAAWVLGGGAVLLLGTGVALLLSVHRVRPVLAAAAAVGTASTGFFLWMGSSWWPSMWGVAWLPWLWLGLRVRGPVGVVVTGLAAWQLTASGYPYVLPVAGVLVLAHLAELRVSPTERAGRPAAARVLAGAAGVLTGAPNLVGAQEMVASSTRSAPPVTPVGNAGILIPNFLDTVVGGSTLTPSVSGMAGGYLFVVPVAATGSLALASLALVRWRSAVVRPGVMTAVCLTAVALVLTQLPTDVGPLRYPFRYLSVVSLAITVLGAVAVTAAPGLSRRRFQLAGALLAIQFTLAVLRGPTLLLWHTVAVATAAAGLVALVVVLRPGVPAGGAVVAAAGPRGRPRSRLPPARHAPGTRLAAVLLLVTAVGGSMVGVLAARSTGTRIDDQAGRPGTGAIARQLQTRDGWGTTVADFESRSALIGRSVTALVYGDFSSPTEPEDQGWSAGVLPGNANLLSGLRPGFGYAAVGHRAWLQRWCQDLLGLSRDTPGCVDQLLQVVPGLDVAWFDVLSADDVLVSPSTPAVLRSHLEDTWTLGGHVGAYDSYRRVDELPGRVTWVSAGTTVQAPAGAEVGQAFHSGVAGESVRVTTPAGGGQVVFRIPAWPGLRAELDGRPVPTGSVEGTLLSVSLPGGTRQAVLDLYFAPLADRLVVPAWLTGALLLVTAALLDALSTRRVRRSTG